MLTGPGWPLPPREGWLLALIGACALAAPVAVVWALGVALIEQLP